MGQHLGADHGVDEVLLAPRPDAQLVDGPSAEDVAGGLLEALYQPIVFWNARKRRCEWN